MAKYGYNAYRLWIKKKYVRIQEHENVGNIAGSGVDLLTFAAAGLRAVQRDGFTGDKPDHFVRVDDVRPKGRTCWIKTSSGPYGTPGEMWDVHLGVRTHQYPESEASLTSSRNVLVVPKAGTSALLLAEKAGRTSSASALLDELTTRVDARFDSEYKLHHEGLMAPQAWESFRERAALDSIKVIRYRPGSDLVDRALGPDEEALATIEHVVKPPARMRLAKGLVEKIMKHEVDIPELVGIRADLAGEVSEVVLTLNDGTQQKQYSIESGKQPAFAYILAGDKQPPPTDGQYLSAVLDTAGELFGVLGVQMPPGWRNALRSS